MGNDSQVTLWKRSRRSFLQTSNGLRPQRAISSAAIFVSIAASFVANAAQLDDYIAKPDPSYAWRATSTERHSEGIYAVLQLTSQSWRSNADVDRVVWRHWMEVYVPNQVAHDTALLTIAGGDEFTPPPHKPDGELAKTAVSAKAVVARVRNVPNQPLVFTSDPQRRSRHEDDILAFCWDRHLATSDPEWLVHLPMAKSAIRAMDAVTAFCAVGDRPVILRRFVVSGASKRGWTTWLTAAADKRVVAIAPMVIDLLNLEPSFRHHHAAYGRYADAVKPYVENNIIQRMDQPAMKTSLAILDPYAYRDRLTMPKLLINSTGDQFFLPDSWRFYWNDLAGSKDVRYIPNTDHGLDRTASESLRSFFIAVLSGKSLPAYTWSEEAPGRLRVETKDAPMRVLAWSTTNTAGRDFMLRTIGKTWKSQELNPVKPGVYIGEITEPEKGWSAIVVELLFPDPSGSTTGICLTTGVSVTPARLPFSDRHEKVAK